MGDLGKEPYWGMTAFNPVDIGAALRGRREELQLTQAQLAERMYVRRDAVKRAENEGLYELGTLNLYLDKLGLVPMLVLKEKEQ